MNCLVLLAQSNVLCRSTFYSINQRRRNEVWLRLINSTKIPCIIFCKGFCICFICNIQKCNRPTIGKFSTCLTRMEKGKLTCMEPYVYNRFKHHLLTINPNDKPKLEELNCNAIKLWSLSNSHLQVVAFLSSSSMMVLFNILIHLVHEARCLGLCY